MTFTGINGIDIHCLNTMLKVCIMTSVVGVSKEVVKNQPFTPKYPIYIHKSSEHFYFKTMKDLGPVNFEL